MLATADQPLTFKFHRLDEKGNQVGFGRKAGSFDGQTLKLDDVEIPVAAILQTFSRESRIGLSVLLNDGGNGVVMFMPSSAAVTQELKTAIDVARSHVWGEAHRKDLIEKKLGHTFRSEECPRCQAMLILSDMPRTPQVYCHYCGTLTTTSIKSEPIADEQHLKLCDECGMYSKPRKFTIFYFYFLLVVYGFWSKPTWRCPACMRGVAWQMLFGNLLFVLGVPVAIVQLFRSYGFTELSGPFKGLDKGNIHARKGNFEAALAQYREIMNRVPNCAGLKYNLGLALLQQGDKASAAKSFASALDDCANYAPAYQRLRPLYEELGDAPRLAALKSQWETPEAAPA